MRKRNASSVSSRVHVVETGESQEGDNENQRMVGEGEGGNSPWYYDDSDDDGGLDISEFGPKPERVNIRHSQEKLVAMMMEVADKDESEDDQGGLYGHDMRGNVGPHTEATIHHSQDKLAAMETQKAGKNEDEDDQGVLIGHNMRGTLNVSSLTPSIEVERNHKSVGALIDLFEGPGEEEDEGGLDVGELIDLFEGPGEQEDEGGLDGLGGVAEVGMMEDSSEVSSLSSAATKPDDFSAVRSCGSSRSSPRKSPRRPPTAFGSGYVMRFNGSVDWETRWCGRDAI